MDFSVFLVKLSGHFVLQVLWQMDIINWFYPHYTYSQLIFLIPIVVSIDLIVEYQLLWNRYQKWILPIVHAHKQYYLVILIPIAVSIDLIMEFLVKGEKEE